MPKYWGKPIFSLGSFPEVGQKQKTEREKTKKRKLVITRASYALQTPPRVAHAKPSGPKDTCKDLLPFPAHDPVDSSVHSHFDNEFFSSGVLR